jgi:hypothetical protein
VPRVTLDAPSGAYFSGSGPEGSCSCGEPNNREEELCGCGRKKPYRDLLWREVNPEGNGALAVCGLNPSTANAADNDRTISKLIRLARRLGYRWLIMVNLFSYRLTDSKKLAKIANPVGGFNTLNMDYLRAVALEHGLLCAWGKNGSILARGARVKRELLAAGAQLTYLRLLGDGQPEHPLYIPDAIDPKQWPRADGGGTI